MRNETLVTVGLIALVGGIFYWAYQLIEPYLAPIIWGAILAIAFRPVHGRVRRRFKKPGTAAFVMTALVTLVILVPAAYLTTALVGEAIDLSTNINRFLNEQGLTSWEEFQQHPLVKVWLERLQGYVDLSRINPREVAVDAASRLSQMMLVRTKDIIANFALFCFQFVIMLLVMYYMFKDGDALVRLIRESLPLSQERIDRTFSNLDEVVSATINGGLVVALAQGLTGGLMFWILGLSSPVLWGVVMGFLSLLPVVGAPVVFVPAALYLLITGSWIKALVLAGVGFLVITQLDNILRPILISGRTKMHPMILFLSILGGIHLFGFLGVIMGPVLAAVFLAALDLYRQSLREDIWSKVWTPAVAGGGDIPPDEEGGGESPEADGHEGDRE